MINVIYNFNIFIWLVFFWSGYNNDIVSFNIVINIMCLFYDFFIMKWFSVCDFLWILLIFVGVVNLKLNFMYLVFCFKCVYYEIVKIFGYFFGFYFDFVIII